MSVGSKPIIVFNCTKNEAFAPSKRFKTWARSLSRTFEVRENNDKYPSPFCLPAVKMRVTDFFFISELSEAGLRGASLLVFGSPREKFNKGEIEAIQACVVPLLLNQSSVFCVDINASDISEMVALCWS
jgi:hypothetical protein